MKRKPSVLILMSAALTAAVLATSCKKEAVQGPDGADDRAMSATIIIPSNPTLSGVLGTGHNVKDTIRLTSSGSWRLSGLVYVDSADVLMIDPGTTIRGNLSTGAGVPGGGLVVCRGAKILAQGTATQPIIFTSAAATPQSGDWAGVVILGNATSNHATPAQIEGVPSNPPANATYGGNGIAPNPARNDADNSGILRHIRIEYAGFELTANNEINGLTFGGVGSQTVVDFVEVYKGRDDAFEWFGGTVNCSHLIAVDALDDMFDADNGYRGTIRFALGLSDTSRADISQSNGLEVDNNSTGSTAAPLTNPKFRKLTIVGLPNQAKAINVTMPPSNPPTGRYGRAAHLRRNTDFSIDSAIFLGFNFGVSLDSALGTTPTKYRANHATWLRHTVSHAYFSGGSPVNISRYISESNGTPSTGAGFAIALPGSVYNWAIADGNAAAATTAAVGLPSPFNRSNSSNFVPVPGTPGAVTAGGGAFPTNWTTGNAFVRLQ